jgi:hypothetical protein
MPGECRDPDRKTPAMAGDLGEALFNHEGHKDHEEHEAEDRRFARTQTIPGGHSIRELRGLCVKIRSQPHPQTPRDIRRRPET